METLGAYAWSVTRGTPGAGVVGLAADPVPGYSNALKVHKTDAHGNDRTALLGAVVSGDLIKVDTDGGTDLAFVVSGAPSLASSVYTFPIIVSVHFLTTNEPANGTDVLLFRNVAAAWPSTTELAQVLNVENVTDWQTTLDRTMAAGIAKVKADVGSWDESVNAPTTNQSQAALRMAELFATRPDDPTNSRDKTYWRLLTGQRKRFGIG